MPPNRSIAPLEEPAGFVRADGYGLYQPAPRHVHVGELIELSYAATRYAREQNISRQVLDLRRLTGFGIPSMSDRFEFSQRLAGASQTMVKVVVVCPVEVIDKRGFGISVARNRGLTAERFASEQYALAWLLDHNTG